MNELEHAVLRSKYHAQAYQQLLDALPMNSPDVPSAKDVQRRARELRRAVQLAELARTAPYRKMRSARRWRIRYLRKKRRWREARVLRDLLRDEAKARKKMLWLMSLRAFRTKRRADNILYLREALVRLGLGMREPGEKEAATDARHYPPKWYRNYPDFEWREIPWEEWWRSEWETSRVRGL